VDDTAIRHRRSHGVSGRPSFILTSVIGRRHNEADVESALLKNLVVLLEPPGSAS